MRIVIVDDDPDVRDALALFVESHGYRVETAANGREAIDRLAAHGGACLVILDLRMPVMSGWDFLRERRADPRLARVPVVVATAAGGSEDERAGLLLGEDDAVMRKPFRSDELVAVLGRYCGKAA